MKNILIFGIGRTGKTTLSNLIKSKYKSYNLIHSDSIKWAIIRADNKQDYYNTHIDKQKDFEYSENFQKILLEFFNSCIRNDNSNYGYILESGQLEPKLIDKYIDRRKTIIICLGLGITSREEIVKMCRNHDSSIDWTYSINDNDLDYHAQNWIERDIYLKSQCEKFNINYVITSQNREKIFKDIISNLFKLN